MGLIITVHGTAGSGKSTTAKLLAARLQIPLFDMGSVRKELAASKGMTLSEFNKISETDPSSDHLVDEYQSQLPQAHPSFVITCRAGFHFLPQSIKVYLTADLWEAARRVLPEQRGMERASTLEEMHALLQEREESDRRRFHNHYNLNTNDPSHYDLVIDTTKKGPFEVMEEIVAFIQSRGYDLPRNA